MGAGQLKSGDSVRGSQRGFPFRLPLVLEPNGDRSQFPINGPTSQAESNGTRVISKQNFTMLKSGGFNEKMNVQIAFIREIFALFPGRVARFVK